MAARRDGQFLTGEKSMSDIQTTVNCGGEAEGKTTKYYVASAINEIIKLGSGCIDIANISDGYHTFDELYRHRAVLFAVICQQFKRQSWKSKLHHDGTMYDGYFIVGIETIEGQATYHYEITRYWELFNVRELDRAPEWDGHTPDEALERIGSLSNIFGGLHERRN